ncbi:MAG: type I-E CRISPR-associated protein Cse2/CasB [Anaerolineae bacterium]|jgi:CRISPR system Cascade subunit CasB|nr:type I-E CRISPR-associated protein Cse2/CasB [Anaerolineae bacterium]
MPSERKQHPFITFLEEHHEDRAMLAELRRGLGRAPGEAAGMFPYIMPFVHSERDLRQGQADDLFLIASLFALHPASAAAGNMGAHLRACAEAAGDDAATSRRFVQLLNLRRPVLDTPLRQHISLLKAQEIRVNWQQLLADVMSWSRHDHIVQKQWAHAYWHHAGWPTKA